MEAAHRVGQSPSSAISNLVVKTVREYTGRGPTKAKTSLNGDSAVVVLRESLLMSERTLIGQGEEELVLQMRRRFQRAMREPLVRGVEEITGRKVTGFLSDSQMDPDISVETFVFEEQTE